MLLLTDGKPSHTYLRVAELDAVLADARPTVYLDTTICSYLAARSPRDALSTIRKRITRDWWLHHRVRYQLRISSLVMQEAARGDVRISRRRVRMMKDIRSLGSDERSDELQSHLIGDGLLPAKAHLDAAHIAIATIHSVRYLLTWNCRHLANPHIARNVVRKCASLGLICPEICTPDQLMRGHIHG